MRVELKEGLYVEVYRNLHKKCWSVRHQGKVIWHTNKVTLKNAKLVVQPAGNARVRREGRKNVHAVVRGYLTWEWMPLEFLEPQHKITYDPYQHTSFVMCQDHSPIARADMVYLHIALGVYVKN